MNSLVTIFPPDTMSGQIAVFSRPDTDSWEYWLPRWISRKALSTRKIYADEIKEFLGWLGLLPVSCLTTTHIEDYQQRLCRSGLKANTIARRIATVCSLVSYIHRRDSQIMPRNVGAAVERVKPDNQLAARILSEEEVLRMFTFERRPRNLALLRVLYSSGCRISEVLGLRWRDIVWRDEDALLTVLGKGGKTRTVAIYGATLDALAAIRPAGDPDGSAFVFTTVHGRLKRIYAIQIIRRAARRAGLNKAVSPHWLRHAAATHALDRGAPLPLVSTTLGHSNLAVTGRYLHCRPKESLGKYHAL